MTLSSQADLPLYGELNVYFYSFEKHAEAQINFQKLSGNLLLFLEGHEVYQMLDPMTHFATIIYNLEQQSQCIRFIDFALQGNK